MSSGRFTMIVLVQLTLDDATSSKLAAKEVASFGTRPTWNLSSCEREALLRRSQLAAHRPATAQHAALTPALMVRTRSHCSLLSTLSGDEQMQILSHLDARSLGNAIVAWGAAAARTRGTA